MRDLSIEEMDLVTGAGLSLGNIVALSGNSVASGNSVCVSDIANGNMIANCTGNDSLNGTGIGNFSLNG